MKFSLTLQVRATIKCRNQEWSCFATLPSGTEKLPDKQYAKLLSEAMDHCIQMVDEQEVSARPCQKTKCG